MKPASLLAELRKRGIRLSLRGDDIIYRAPKGSVTPELLASFQAEKQAIVQELRAEANTDEGGFDHLTRMLQSEGESEFRHPHSYARLVEPIKSRLLSRVGLDINFVRGEGCYLWDEAGNQYLDCIAQYGGLPFGYNPEPIWQALESVRINQLPNVATQSLLDTAGQLAERLLQVAPAGFKHVIFCNSGAEATEVAIKLCRAAKNRPGILSTRKGFHGLTTGSLSATGSESFQNGFFARCDDFEHVPFGDAQALAKALTRSPQHFAAFIVEPIQGEAGIVLPPSGYLTRVREVCDRFDVLMVVDEVQTGLGRTGRLFACEHENVVPDVMTLAKALGGGLVPVGAVLCQPDAYSIRFGLRHSSTFAGNALASACGLATLGELTAENEKLVRHVAECGSYLQHGLQAIQLQFGRLVREVRGCGYMQAIEFDFDVLKSQRGLMPVLVDQDLLMHLIVSHLLHTHHVRVAPSFMGCDVIRLEPPLIAGKAECDQLLSALTQTLETVENGNAAALVANLIDLSADERVRIESARVTSNTWVREIAGVSDGDCPIVGEFGFVVHLSNLNDLVRFDQSLSTFTEPQLAKLKHELTRSSELTVVGSSLFKSVSGDAARGHFVLVPYTPTELLQMPADEATQRIAAAADVSAQLGVQLIGLGGFTSIITAGGVALDADRLPPLTSGNAYTVATTLEAIKSAAHSRNVRLGNATVAIVGAAGQIGRALALMISETAGKMVLVGRDGTGARTQQRLRDVANDIVRHQLNQVGLTDEPAGKFRERLAAISSLAGPNYEYDHDIDRIAALLIDEGFLLLSNRIEEIAIADIVVAVSSATQPFIESRHIKAAAIVCDSSRPANVCPEVIRSRTDVDWIEGGLVRIPDANRLDVFAGPSPDAAYACVAETALWTLEPTLGKPSAQQQLEISTIRQLSAAGKKHGFEFVSLARNQRQLLLTRTPKIPIATTGADHLRVDWSD